MRRVRDLKKSQNLMRSVQSQSREIISSIYASTDADQLQFSQDHDLWNICPQNLKTTIQQPSIHTHQPLKNLLPLMKHLTTQPHFDTCSFILFDYNTLHAVTQESRITVSKDKKDKGRLRYWLSHIYFHRLRKQLTESLIHSGSQEEKRDVIHANEEKQYMPMAFSGKKEASVFVRKFTVSSQAMYSKQGKAERQPFCIGYFLNGAEQLFSFTEVLSFIEYPFNLSEVSYLKILPVEKDGTPKYRASFSKAIETLQQRERIDKFKKILRRQERWRYHKEQIDELKSSMISNKQFEAYSLLALLEMVAFLEINQFIEVKELNVEWIIDQSGNCRLSNCFKYSFDPINTYTTTEGLVTLYERKLLKQNTSDQSETNKAFRVKKIRPEEKSIGRSLTVPPLNCRSLSNHSQMKSSTLSSFRRKAKSAIKCNPIQKWVIR